MMTLYDHIRCGFKKTTLLLAGLSLKYDTLVSINMCRVYTECSARTLYKTVELPPYLLR